MTPEEIDLEQLSALAPLYRKMRMGTHIGRLNEPLLWANLEANHDDYARMFRALGYQLGMDPRGFAWLDEEREDAADESRLTKKVRSLAVFIAALFDFQAGAGKSLNSFTGWRLDEQLLGRVLDSQRESLAGVEVSSVDDMRDQLRTATNWGFCLQVDGGWRLLPAISRFTDSFADAARVVTDEGVEHVEDDQE